MLEESSVIFKHEIYNDNAAYDNVSIYKYILDKKKKIY